MKRQKKAENGKIYHVYNKSISKYVIFRTPSDYERMKHALPFFTRKRKMPFSKYILYRESNYRLPGGIMDNPGDGAIVDIIAYCIMPTHIHILARQLEEDGISRYMNRLLNSYTKHFNMSHNRRGPLWEGRFRKAFLDERLLLEITRYIHLNPVLSFIVDDPGKWEYSSYRQYAYRGKDDSSHEISALKVDPAGYRKYVKDNISFQKGLETIRPLLLE